jgi:hypothetical protein
MKRAWVFISALLALAILVFLCSHPRMIDGFKETMQMKETRAPTAPKPVPAKPAVGTSAPPTRPSSAPTIGGGLGGSVTINKSTNTITIPGQGPQTFQSSKCSPNGICTYFLQNGESLTIVNDKIMGVGSTAAGPSPSPTPAPAPPAPPVPTPSPSSEPDVAKSTPAPYSLTPMAITCPNGEPSTTGCCANGEPQGKYPCCPNGKPSRQGNCDA